MKHSLADRRTRTVQILGTVAAVLCLALAVLALSRPDAPGRAERTGKPVIPGFAELRTEAQKIKVTLADTHYTLAATERGWVLDSASGYPVDAAKLSEFADGLGKLTWGEGRTRDPAKFDRIGLGDPTKGGTGALVEIFDAQGTARARLIAGKRDARVYARLPDETRAFMVTGTLPALHSAEAWLDLQILTLSADTVKAVRLTDSTGDTLYLVRDAGEGDRDFRPGPPDASRKLLSRMAASTPALALTRFNPIGVKPAASLNSRPVARHITETHDGMEIDLQAYREADGFFVTLRAIEAGEGANLGASINGRAEGWAFELTEFDWMEFTPVVSEIVE